MSAQQNIKSHISSPQHRPPHDLGCPMLQVVTGCSHGKCHFCDIFNGVPFAASPEEEVKADIKEIARTATALTRRIYLTGGNPFALPTHRLIEIFDMVEERIPTVNSYGGFCRIVDVASKSDEELALLASRGVNRITIGAESGFDEALEFMEKGHTAADIVEQGRRLHEAGIDFTFFYLAGMAGAGRGEENAIASARAFSAANPSDILIVTLTPTQTWPLARDIAAGTWAAPTEGEMAREIRTFIEHLTCTCHVNCAHDTDVLRFEGMVPEAQGLMLELLDNLIPKMNEGAARRMREMLHKASF
ncbi:radical SAM protein [Adlercreutzia sp. ZJ242]|uniref:radical SAM protein n=1 Tax=Adlercreutzia sp. ZJ242 TaxID=2709409 RepID=UPI0013ED1238|nr:radical SAM protein [Adlercreutzia sp. ZJ242]